MQIQMKLFSKPTVHTCLEELLPCTQGQFHFAFTVTVSTFFSTQGNGFVSSVTDEPRT